LNLKKYQHVSSSRVAELDFGILRLTENFFRGVHEIGSNMRAKGCVAMLAKSGFGCCFDHHVCTVVGTRDVLKTNDEALDKLLNDMVTDSTQSVEQSDGETDSQ
jgi:hypothetical protein